MCYYNILIHSPRIPRCVTHYTHTHTRFEVSWRHTQAQKRKQRETHQSPYLLSGRELRERETTEDICD